MRWEDEERANYDAESLKEEFRLRLYVCPPEEVPNLMANEYAEKGTVMYYLLKKGFLPNDEAAAERILDRIINEWEKFGV